MRITIKDIAKDVGVSIMTVSRVMNNSGYVSKEARNKIEQAIKRMGYRPNLIARSLILKKSEFLHIVVPDIANPFFAELIKGAERVASKYGYNVIVSETDWTEALEIEHLEGAIRRMVEGVILVAPKLSLKEIIKFNKAIPLIIVDRPIKNKSISSVYIDNKQGAFTATAHLIDLGHTRIAFISGPMSIMNSVRRLKGYLAALEAYGISVDKSLIYHGDFKYDSGRKIFDLISNLPVKDRPTAVFASNDLMALGLMQRALEAGWSIPGDLSILGFDDILLSSLVTPPLTTVSHPYVKMGERAVTILLKILQNNIDTGPFEKLKNVFIERKSTKALATHEEKQ